MRLDKVIKSREGWKLKSNKRKCQVKRLQVNKLDLEKSRDYWKDEAKHYKSLYKEAMEKIEIEKKKQLP